MTALAVSAIIPSGRYLMLTKREGLPPTWAFPGGHVQKRESLSDAIRREVLEETHLTIAPVALLTELELRTRMSQYVLFVFACRLTSLRAPSPGDDASEARWVPTTEVPNLMLAPGMRSTLASCTAN